MDGFVHLLADAVQPPQPDQSVKIAIITAISVVVAAALTAVAGTMGRERPDEHGDHEQDFIDELVRRADIADRRTESVERHISGLRSEVDRLEHILWRARVDPDTGRPL